MRVNFRVIIKWSVSIPSFSHGWRSSGMMNALKNAWNGSTHGQFSTILRTLFVQQTVNRSALFGFLPSVLK